jgi:hypothetical protein
MPAMGHRVSEVGIRGSVLERGHCHRDQRTWGWDWTLGLRLEVEVWDMLDETCLLSADCELIVTDHPYALILDGAGRCEVVGPVFSAASRDPVQGRFASIDDYFRRGPGATVDEPIVVRVYVRDERRGRQALLWDTRYQGGELLSTVVAPHEPLWAQVPEGSRCVRNVGFLPIYSTALPGQEIGVRTELVVNPMPGQEEVAEADKMWRVVGIDEHDCAAFVSGFRWTFGPNVEMAHLVTLVRGLLEPGCC